MLFINIAGLLLIVFIVWWFWFYNPKGSVSTNNDLTIVVNNGVYTPARIVVAADKPVQLYVLRKDASACAEMLLIPDLDISENLPLNKTKTVSLPALKPGKYPFHCQMQMYRGELIVE